MKKKRILLMTFLYSVFPMCFCYAENGFTEKRTDIAAMTAIAELAQMASWLVFVFSVGLYILSMKEENAAMKSNSLKLFLIFLAGQVLLPLLQRAGLAY